MLTDSYSLTGFPLILKLRLAAVILKPEKRCTGSCTYSLVMERRLGKSHVPDAV